MQPDTMSGTQLSVIAVAFNQQPKNPSLAVLADPGRVDPERNAAIATDLASLGSFFCERPEPSTRTRDTNTGGTSNTVSPTATSWRASKKPSPLADSIAHRRSLNSLAQSQSRRAWAFDAPRVNSSSTTSLLSIATAVWVALWGSIPIMMVIEMPFRLMMEPWRALLIRVDVLSPLSSHATAERSGR